LPSETDVSQLASEPPQDARGESDGRESRHAGLTSSGGAKPQLAATTPSSVPSISESLKPNGLELPDEYTFKDWAKLAGMVAGMNTNRQWWAGDLILAGERFGERATQHWNDLGYKWASLANCIRVCRRFPYPLRHEYLQFSHHAVVYALDDEWARKWLNEAEVKGWTVKQLREAVFGPKPKTHKWTLDELRERLAAWPGDASLRNNSRRWAEVWLETLE